MYSSRPLYAFDDIDNEVYWYSSICYTYGALITLKISSQITYWCYKFNTGYVVNEARTTRDKHIMSLTVKKPLSFHELTRLIIKR